MYTIFPIFLNRIGQIEMPISTKEGMIVVLFEEGELLKVRDERTSKERMLREYLESDTAQEMMDTLKIASKKLSFLTKGSSYPPIYLQESKFDLRTQSYVTTFKFESLYFPFHYDEKTDVISCELHDIRIQVDEAIHQKKRIALVQSIVKERV